VRANPQSVHIMQTLMPDYICLDRSATQLLVSQGSEHPELARIMQHSRDKSMHIVAFPLQDAHSMAMLWQRGVNMVRGSVNQLAAA
jgi:EAL domain-containing protein (putative c-di-GMP-specific phosphodiesterase class I)